MNKLSYIKFFGLICICVNSIYHCDDHIFFFISTCISAVHIIFIPYKNVLCKNHLKEFFNHYFCIIVICKYRKKCKALS